MAGKEMSKGSWGFRVGERLGNPSGDVQGYVVLSDEGEFLSRRMQWIRHRDDPNCTSLQQGYVHQPAVLVSGGPWASKARGVYAAVYNVAYKCTEVKLPETPFEDFLRRERAKQSA